MQIVVFFSFFHQNGIKFQARVLKVLEICTLKTSFQSEEKLCHPGVG